MPFGGGKNENGEVEGDPAAGLAGAFSADGEVPNLGAAWCARVPEVVALVRVCEPDKSPGSSESLIPPNAGDGLGEEEPAASGARLKAGGQAGAEAGAAVDAGVDGGAGAVSLETEGVEVVAPGVGRASVLFSATTSCSSFLTAVEAEDDGSGFC